MEDLQITKGQIYISMTINKLMFRKISMQKSNVSYDKIQDVTNTIEELKYALETIKTLENEYRAVRSRVFDLELHWLIAKKETNEQIKKNEELIKLI